MSLTSFDLATCRFAFHHFARPREVLAEMARVLKPGARMVIVDMTTAEDSAKSDYHNRVERLCDPSHARAIPVSEWERMIAEADLEVSYRGGRETSYDLESWMAHGGPPPERRAQIIEMMEASLEADRSGLKVRRQDGRDLVQPHGRDLCAEQADALAETARGRVTPGRDKSRPGRRESSPA